MAERKYFGKLGDVIEPPPFIEGQIQSYEEFLQATVAKVMMARPTWISSSMKSARPRAPGWIACARGSPTARLCMSRFA